MSEKNVLFSISYYTPYVSGLTICAQRVAENLAENNKVEVLCMKHNRFLVNSEIINRIKIVRANPLFKIGKGFISIDWIRKSWQIAKDADTTVVNLPQFEGFIPALIAKALHKKVVVIYHCEVTMKNKLMQTLLDLTSIGSLYLADRVVVYTKDYAENSRILKYFKNKWVEIYPPIPSDKGLGHRSLGRGKIRNKLVLGVAARLAEEKGVEYLLEAIPQIEKIIKKPVILKIAGPIDPVGETDYKDKIMNLVNKIKDKVMFLGNLNQQELKNFYKEIDILVLPSINSTEAFGIVQVEAMLQGTPVVASNLPGVRIPIRKTKMGELANPKDVKSLTEAIVKVYRNKYLNTAKEMFNAGQSYKKYRNVILGND